MKRILITGGSGFIGSHLARKLSENYKVTVLDNLSFGKEKFENENIEFIEGDICKIKDLGKSLEGIDAIVHLAAIVSVNICENYPDKCIKNNTTGTENIFKAAKEKGINKIIFASSAAVYGDLSSSRVSENDKAVPISNYGKSKLENEITAQKYEKHINSIGLRFFNVYGPGLLLENAYPSVLISFFQKINDGLPIKIFGDGKQTRDFVHVYDIVNAIEKSIEKETDGFKAINVGSGQETSIIEIAEKIKSIRPNIEIEFDKPRDFDIEKSCADISVARNYLEYKPRHHILEDIENMLELYTKHE